jgi:hypothetical protein
MTQPLPPKRDRNADGFPCDQRILVIGRKNEKMIVQN